MYWQRANSGRIVAKGAPTLFLLSARLPFPRKGRVSLRRWIGQGLCVIASKMQQETEKGTIHDCFEDAHIFPHDRLAMGIDGILSLCRVSSSPFVSPRQLVDRIESVFLRPLGFCSTRADRVFHWLPLDRSDNPRAWPLSFDLYGCSFLGDPEASG